MESERMINVYCIGRNQAWAVVDQVLEHNIESLASENPLNKMLQREFNAISKF